MLSHRQKLARDRLVFDDDLITTLAAESIDETQAPLHSRRERLHLCIARLPERQRGVITSRYFDSESVAAIATRMGIDANNVSQLLHRARKNLFECLNA